MDVSTWTGDGATGAGQKVAIIDSGFDGYQSAQASGDLPALTTRNFCGSGNFRNTQHGTGVAEIVHDVAPQAALTLICVSSVSDLDQAVDYAITNGIDVVNHSVGWFNSSRGDGSGGPMSPEGIAGRAVDAGIVWVQAAGNHANRHWNGKYNDASGDGFHEYDPGVDETNAFLLAPGQTVVVFLKWDRWPTTGLDYDLGLWSHDIGDFVAVSNMTQNGNQPPVEALAYFNPGPTVLTLGVAIDKFAGGDARPRMDVFITVNTLQYRDKAGSVVEPAGHPDLLTVGATCWADDDLASYSSRGPNIAGVAKPDVAAPTGVTTTAYGAGDDSCNFGFTGTSSAAPHAAGMAALILDTKGGLQPDRVKELMQVHTIDLGPSGHDNRFGAGRVNAFGLCHGEVPNVIGTDGADVLKGTAKSDVISAYGGHDVVDGKGGKDLVCGDAGDDALFGGNGSDELRGGPGDDVLEGGTGADLLIGSSGLNTASYESAANPVIVNLANETAKGGAGKDTLKSISRIIGSDFGDTLKGDDGDNVILGGKGPDLIMGRGGNDTGRGGKGDDRIEGGGGADNLFGQAGGDMVLGMGGDDHLIGGPGTDTVFGGDGTDTCETFENLNECEL
jgi:Ca2+-binding RTX toxin-like protein